MSPVSLSSLSCKTFSLISTILLLTPIHSATVPVSVNRLPTLHFPLSTVDIHLAQNLGTLFPAASEIIKDPILTNDLSIAVPLPPQYEVKSSQSLVAFHTDFLKTSLPLILAQFNVPKDQIQAKVDGGIPLLEKAMKELFGDDIMHAKRSDLAIRSIWSDIGGFFGDVGCGILAASVGVPAFLYSAAIFAAENHGASTSLNADQQFFTFPVHGDIANTGPVRMFYQATRAIGFDKDAVKGTTFNRDVYTALPNALNGADPVFKYLIKNVILHELSHVLQYKDLGYNLVRFADKYSFEVCKDGYWNMWLEKQARASQNMVDALLVDNDGWQFYVAWATRNLGFGTYGLGYPTVRTYVRLPADPRGPIIELPFQHGLLQVIPRSSFRVFTADEIRKRTLSSGCKITKLCKRKAEPLQEGQPIGGHPDDFFEARILRQEEEKAANEECKTAKSSWQTLDNRPFVPYTAVW